MPETQRLTQSELDSLVRLHKRFLEGRMGGRRAHLRGVDLSGLSLNGQDLRQATFVGCLMMHMDLAQARFQEASVYACDLSFSKLDESVFNRADMRGVRIENASLRGADLADTDMRIGAVSDGSYGNGKVVNFRGANLSGARLSGSLATQADFSDAIMSGANLSRADMRGAVLEGADLTNAQIEGTQFQGANLKAAIMIGIPPALLERMNVDLTPAITEHNIGRSVMQIDVPLMQLLQSHHDWVGSAGAQGQRMDLSNMDLRALRTLEGERLTAINAKNAKLFGINLHRVQLQKAMMDGSDFRYCDLVEADLRGGSFSESNFAHAKMKNMRGDALILSATGTGRRSTPCNFEFSRFRYADLTGANFKGAQLRGADFSWANLTGADLREADLRDVDLTGAILDGAKRPEES